MGYWFEFCVVRAVFALLGFVPLALSGWLIQRIADLYYFCSPTRRHIALENLTRAYGDTLSAGRKRAIARKSFESQALAILELFLIKQMKRGASRRFYITGQPHVEQANARGKGAIFVAAHFGAWEFIGFPGYLQQYPHAVVVKQLKNHYFNKMINVLRREIETVPIHKVNAIRPVLGELHRNHGVAIFIDQWAGAEGLWVDFLGTATSTTSLPARLAKKTGCALLPIFCIRKAIGQYEVHIFPAVPVPDEPDWELRTTKRLNDILASQIRTYPDQWSWNHRRWKPKPRLTPDT